MRSETRRFWWHWQNLTQEDDRAKRRRFPWSGRAWLHSSKRPNGAIGEIEWGFGKAAWSTRFGIKPRLLSVGVRHVFSIYLTLPFRIWPFKPCEVYWLDWDLVWSFFLNESMSWPRRPRVSRLREGRWRPRDTFFGRPVYAEQLVESRDVLIPMPEGPYPARAELKLATWRRPRWPRWPLRIERMRCHIEVPIGIPHEGKGENSWDCGEDGIWGQTAQAQSIEEGVANLVESSLRNRRRYGKSEPGAYPHPDERARLQAEVQADGYRAGEEGGHRPDQDPLGDIKLALNTPPPSDSDGGKS